MTPLIQFTRQLQTELDKQFSTINEQEEEQLEIIGRSINAANEILTRLKSFIQQYAFSDKQEEIRFYKEIGPAFHAHLVFFVRVYQTEIQKPIGGIDDVDTFYKDQLKHIHQFFIDNKGFYKYYRSGSVGMDHAFFVSDSTSSELAMEEYSHVLDSQLCTTQGYKIAIILAYERLQEYLTKKRQQLYKATNENAPQIIRFKWTGPKVALTELMYALVYSGMINNGQITVKELAEFLEFVFQTDLGNYYRTRQEMYSRKKTASFLELLIKRFQQGMDEADEKFRS